jgi:hypothetical protein
MRGRTLFWTIAVAAIGGCGGGDEKPQATATATATATAAEVRPARSAEACIDVWNADARLGTAGQKTPADYLADLAADHRTRAQSVYFESDCVVIAPVAAGSTRVYLFVARGGRAPFGLPSQSKIPAGRRLQFNVEATEQGKLEPIS